MARVLVTLAAMLTPLALVAALELIEVHATAEKAMESSREVVSESAAITHARDALRTLENAVAAAASGRADARQMSRLIAHARRTLRATRGRMDEPEARRLHARAEAAFGQAAGLLHAQLEAGPRRHVGFYMAIDAADRALADAMRAELREIDEESAEFHAVQHRRTIALVVLLAAALATAVVFVLRLRRDVRGPLGVLHDAARRLGEGQLEHRVPRGRWVEFNVLAQAFNEMGDRLASGRRELLHQAFHDDLTGLPNRALLSDRAERALARARRHPEPRPLTALVLLDIDRFKLVNDTLGHSSGDDLLVEVSRRLRATVRPHDTIARLGGDEFVVLLEDLGDPVDATHAAERLLLAFAPPCTVGGREIPLHASVGVAVAQGDDSVDELVRNADVAMYQAKADGRGGYRVFESSMRERVVERMRFEQELAPALEERRFVLHYQPLIDIATGRLDGFEALVRWDHPVHGLLPPSAFIGIAEETGMIVPLGRWVLAEAVAQLRDLRDAHPELELCMGVNVSPHQFRDDGFTADVGDLLRDTGLPRGTLVLEVTEGLLLGDEQAAGRLRDLQALGVRIAIDDFGTGYSALSYLHRFPVDTLKIDRAFIASLGAAPGPNERIVRAIVDLGRALGLRTVGEGVESAEQLERLRQLGCDYAQGYLLAKPLPASALGALLDGLCDGRLLPPRRTPVV